MREETASIMVEVVDGDRVPRLEVAIACVDYADFLALTLPHTMHATRSIASRVTVLTAPWDEDSQRCARSCGAETMVTASWRARGTKFDKARGLNEWVDRLDARPTWRLLLDADILLPPDIFDGLAELDTGTLHGAHRRMCAREDDWNAFAAGGCPVSRFPLDVLPVIDGKVWGRLHTSNLAALCGYFQLWHPSSEVGAKRFVESGTAAGYDVRFAVSYPEDRRAVLPDHEVLHLGPPELNWNGRATSTWTAPSRIAPGTISWV